MLYRLKSKTIACSAALALLLGGVNAADAVNPSGSTIYGYKAWSSDPEYKDLGWYEISAEGVPEMLWYDDTDVMPAYYISGWLDGEHLCGIYGNASYALYIEYDKNIGKLTNVYEINIEEDNFYRYMFTAAYNPADGYVYGFSFSKDYKQDYFVKAPASDLNAVEIIREMPDDYTLCMSCCFNPTDHHMYGIDFLGDLIRIDVNGNFEVTANYGFDDAATLANWASGMTFSPRDNAYFWNRQGNTYESSWVKIDASTYEYTKVRDLKFLDLFTVLECVDGDGDDNGPKQPALKSHSLNSGSYDGSLCFLMPSEDKNGNTLNGELKWVVSDGKNENIASGTAAPGEEVSMNLSALEPGEYTVAVATTTGDNKKGDSLYVNTWIGTDRPALVRDIKVENATDGYLVSWSPVSKGAHGGYVDTDVLKYHLYVGDTEVAETVMPEAVITMPDGFKENKFRVALVAEASGLTSEAAYSAEFQTRGEKDLPYYMTPTDEELEQVTIINVDGDRSTWKAAKDFQGNKAFFCSADQNNPSNDWLILPALNFATPDFKYEVEFSACGNSNTKTDEYLEVRVGSEPDPAKMTTVALERTNIAGTAYKTLAGRFSWPVSGTAYMAFHSVSPAKMSGIYVRDIKISVTEENGIDDVAADSVRVMAVPGGISISGLTEGAVAVYGADGRRAAMVENAAQCEFIPLVPGLYVVCHGSQIFKTIVK